MLYILYQTEKKKQNARKKVDIKAIKNIKLQPDGGDKWNEYKNSKGQKQNNKCYKILIYQIITVFSPLQSLLCPISSLPSFLFPHSSW